MEDPVDRGTATEGVPKPRGPISFSFFFRFTIFDSTFSL
jgi:hypothetical protein